MTVFDNTLCHGERRRRGAVVVSRSDRSLSMARELSGFRAGTWVPGVEYGI